MTHPLDDPRILRNLFYVRKTLAGGNPAAHVHDGRIAVEEEVEVGYRLYTTRPEQPLILYFHGNGEIASDYDDLASFYAVAGVSLLVVDYRGYGWSSGHPLLTKLLPDAVSVLEALPDLLRAHGMQGAPLVVMGRSLGSALAIHLAAIFPEQIAALIVDSGYAEAPSIFERLGVPLPHDLPGDEELPLFSAEKMRRVQAPVLLLHGTEDELIPFENAKALFAAAPSGRRLLVPIEGAGHNNLIAVRPDLYFDAVRTFIRRYVLRMEEE